MTLQEVPNQHRIQSCIIFRAHHGSDDCVSLTFTNIIVDCLYDRVNDSLISLMASIDSVSNDVHGELSWLWCQRFPRWPLWLWCPLCKVPTWWRYVHDGLDYYHVRDIHNVSSDVHDSWMTWWSWKTLITWKDVFCEDWFRCTVLFHKCETFRSKPIIFPTILFLSRCPRSDLFF